jgi:hypothetical protein
MDQRFAQRLGLFLTLVIEMDPRALTRQFAGFHKIIFTMTN